MFFPLTCFAIKDDNFVTFIQLLLGKIKIMLKNFYFLFFSFVCRFFCRFLPVVLLLSRPREMLLTYVIIIIVDILILGDQKRLIGASFGVEEVELRRWRVETRRFFFLFLILLKLTVDSEFFFPDS